MAGGAGALAATVRVDAGNVVVDRAAYQLGADRHIYSVRGAVVFDIGDLRHIIPLTAQPASSRIEHDTSASLDATICFRRAIIMRPAMNSAGAFTASTDCTVPSSAR